MNRLDKPHFIYYLWDMPAGLHPLPTVDEVWASINRMKEQAFIHGSGKAYDRGVEDLESDEELFKRIWEADLSNHNGGLRIEQVMVMNKEDAKVKIKELSKTEYFVKFMFPLSTYGMEDLK